MKIGIANDHAATEMKFAVMKHLEEQDVSEISANISAVEAELNLEIADTNESAVWSKFANAVILGDSRAAGFSYYEFVPEERVLAKNGGADVTAVY